MALLASHFADQRTLAPERFSVASGSLPARLERWSEVAATALVPFEMRPSAHTPEDFRGTITRWRFGELALVDCAAAPCTGYRGPALAHHDEGPLLGLQVMLRGSELARARDREVTLLPGDAVLWDSERSVDVLVEVPEPMHKRILLFPREHVACVSPRLTQCTILPPLLATAAGRLLVRYMNDLALELPALDVVGRTAAACAAVDLLRAALEPILPSSREIARAAMREDIRRYVRKHLQDPELGPSSIARAYSISVRALHGLFEDVEESVAGIVRSERLARCMEDLQQAHCDRVTTVAFRWGFRDTSHFCRAFKREFGVTPSAVRQAALESGER